MTAVAASEAAPTLTEQRPGMPRAGLPRLAVVGIYAAAFIGLTVLYYFAARRTTGGDSDVATLVLQGQAVDHGNVLLNGWRMGGDSFWSVEVPFYAVAVALFGVGPRLLFLVPAACAALTVLVCCRVAIGSRRGWPAAASVAAVVAILGLPTGAWAIFFLHGGWHVVTVLWCLLALVAISRGQWGLRWAVAVLFLAAGLLGDLQALPYGVVPIFAAGVVIMARSRNWRRGLPTLSAAVGGCVVAFALRLVFDAVGTFRIGTLNPHATRSQMIANLRDIPSFVTQAFGIGTRPLGTPGLPTVLAGVHVVSLVAVVVALLIALVGLVRGMVQGPSGPAKPGAGTQGPSGPAKPGAGTQGPSGDDEVRAGWRLDDLLVLGCLADFVFFVYAALSSSPLYLRYLTAFVVFGGLLAARLAGRAAARFTKASFRRTAAALAAVVIALYAAGVADSLRRPEPVFTASDLGSYLLQHGLTRGIGTYWIASITTVVTDGKVVVRPIAGGAKIERYPRQSGDDWYTGHTFQFLVMQPGLPWPGVTDASATATFGPPSQTVNLPSYQILIWNHSITVPADGPGAPG